MKNNKEEINQTETENDNQNDNQTQNNPTPKRKIAKKTTRKIIPLTTEEIIFKRFEMDYSKYKEDDISSED